MPAGGGSGIDCSSISAALAASRTCSTLSYLTDCTAFASAGFMWESTSMPDSGTSFGATLSPLTACRQDHIMHAVASAPIWCATPEWYLNTTDKDGDCSCSLLLDLPGCLHSSRKCKHLLVKFIATLFI